MRRFVKWWRSKSIRFQLTAFVFLFIIVMSVALLAIVYEVDKNERRKVAFQLTQMVSLSLDEYFQDALKGDPDDLVEHLEAFPAVDVVELFDIRGQRVFRYLHADVDYEEYAPFIGQADTAPLFFHGGEDMVVYHPIRDEKTDMKVGRAVFVVDVESLSSQLKDNALYLAVFMPLFLLVGGGLAYQISRVYNAPIEHLTRHMRGMRLDALKPLRPGGHNGSREIRTLYVGFNRLILNLRQMTERLRRQALEDELTGVLNRRGLQAYYASLTNESAERKAVFVAINLDHFRAVNSEAGQQAGDALLRQVAGTLKLVLPEEAVIARPYGDYFQVVIPGKGVCDRAEEMVERVKDALGRLETPVGRLSVTMGWLCFEPGSWSYDLLCRALENAINRAREQGRGTVLRYDPDQQESCLQEQDMRVLGQIRKALEGNGARFELYAQPIVPLARPDAPVGYEVLIRMFDERGEMITPDRFLGAAQRYNLMHEIDRWVVERCIGQLAQNTSRLEAVHKIHINLSGPTLYAETFLEAIKALVDRHRSLPWHKIEFELTETAAVSNFNRAKGFIEWCQRQGIGFALDDFGTGTASFEYLKLLPFDTVKIDGLFIRNMHRDPMDLAVIRHIREMTRLKGQETVAEFVETAEDVALLKTIGIDYGQGYYFSRPVPLSEILGN